MTMAAGRALVITYFRSWRCGVAVGDFSISWRSDPPGGDFIELEPIEGVRVFAHRRLVGLLGAALPELWPGGILSRGTPSLRLALPELWTDFLDGIPIVGPAVEA